MVQVSSVRELDFMHFVSMQITQLGMVSGELDPYGKMLLVRYNYFY